MTIDYCEVRSPCVYSEQGRTSSRVDTDSDSGQPADTDVDGEGFLGHPVTVQQEYVYSTEPTAAAPPRVVAGSIPSCGVRVPAAQPSRVTTQAHSAVGTFLPFVTSVCVRLCR